MGHGHQEARRQDGKTAAESSATQKLCTLALADCKIHTEETLTE